LSKYSAIAVIGQCSAWRAVSTMISCLLPKWW